jgi:voltage-gated sodium channel
LFFVHLAYCSFSLLRYLACMSIARSFRDLVEQPRFQNAIIAVIILNAITLGLETSAQVMGVIGGGLMLLDKLVLGIFVVELAMRIIAYGPRFFTKGWNLFDFTIVAISLMPDSGALSVLRSLRILRALRLFSVVPSMRKVIGGLFRALPGIGSVSMIMALIFYIFAVMATKLYGESFPEWFGTLGATMYTLFQVMTLESWSMGIVRPVMEQHAHAWLFFVSYILATTFTMLNLFIAVILNAMHDDEEKHAEESREGIKLAILEANSEMEARLMARMDALEGRKNPASDEAA